MMPLTGLRDEDFEHATAHLDRGFAEPIRPSDEQAFRQRVTSALADAIFLGVQDPAHLLTIIDASLRFYPSSKPNIRAEYALLLCRSWLRGTTFTLLATDALRMALDVVADGIASTSDFPDWAPVERAIRASAVNRSTGKRPWIRQADDEHDVLRAFLSTAMAKPWEWQLNHLKYLLTDFAWELESNGVFAFAPGLLRDRRIPGEEWNAPGLLQVDEEMMAVSDVAILFDDPPSNGVGMMARLAVELQVPIVLVTGHEDLPEYKKLAEAHGEGIDSHTSTTMVDDQNDVVSIIVRSDPILATAQLTDLFARPYDPLGLKLEEHRSDREVRYLEARVTRDAFRRVWDEMTAYELATLPREAAISDHRLNFLLTHPLNFVAAVGREKRALALRVPLHVEPLDPVQRRAGRLAQARGGWADERSTELESMVMRQIARAPYSEQTRLRQASQSETFWMNCEEQSRP